MSIQDYIRGQRENLESISKLPHFLTLGPLLDELYNRAIALVPKGSQPHFGMLLLLCHKSFLSAITLIAQGQPDDAAAIARRAIEVAQTALAVKVDPENAEAWVAHEARMARWKARDEGLKPKPLRPNLTFPKNHPVLSELQKHLGLYSDAYIHFTPEFYGGQNWHRSENRVELRYFVSDQRTIERELITLVGVHASILRIFDECLDGAFFANADWVKVWKMLEEHGRPLAKQFEPPQQNKT